MSRKKNRKRLSKLSRRLILQYFATVLGAMAGIVFLAFLGIIICSTINWQSYDILYILLNYIQNNLFIIIALLMLASWVAVTCIFISRPLRYLDELVSAASALASPTDAPIVLSDEIASIEPELNRVREKAISDAKAAQEAEQRKNDLVVYLAHDLKTPLTSVIGYLTLLHDEEQISPALRQKYLSISLDKAQRLEDLINEFFEITRFNLTSPELQFSKCNLTRLLEQLVFEFNPMLAEKSLKCNLQEGEDINIYCDVNKLQRVFDNLLKNAVYYSFEESEIEITAKQTDTETLITFKNHGNTIPPEKLGRIFEQFYRLDASRGTNSGGAGLGLAIAKQIVELHNGTISAQSEGETIEFTVALSLS